MAKAVCCLIGAMVGAGFASGREILHFFSRWGAFSWPLIMGTAGLTAALMSRAMERDLLDASAGPGRVFPFLRKTLPLLLLIAAAGGMTAAAGELAALTLPIRRARLLGGAVTLGVCLPLCRRPTGVLSALGGLLLPALTLTLIACLRSPPDKAVLITHSRKEWALPLLQAAGYCGLNVTLAAGVLRDVGAAQGKKRQRRIAAATGAVFGLLLCLGNAVLLPHAGTMEREALPFVLLLRRFGKTGYYASAALLYLAVVSTLLSVLRGIIALLPGRCRAAWAGVFAAGASLMGFEDLVGTAYPALGLLSILLFVPPGESVRRRKKKSIRGLRGS